MHCYSYLILKTNQPKVVYTVGEETSSCGVAAQKKVPTAWLHEGKVSRSARLKKSYNLQFLGPCSGAWYGCV